MQSFFNNLDRGVLFSLFVLGLFMAAAYGTGYLLTRCGLRASCRRNFAAVIIDITLGLDVLGLITLTLGVLKLLNPVSIWILLGVPALAGGGMGLGAALKAGSIFLRKNLFFSILLIGIAVFTLGSALCFPYAWDEMTYHVALPFRWIAAGSLAVFADNPFSGFPSLTQLLFRLGCQNGGILFPRLLTWAVYSIMFAALYLYFKPYGGRLTVMFMTFMFIADPLVINMMRETYAEPFIMLNLLASLLMIREAEPSRKTLFRCGLLAGGAVAVKLTGIAAAAVIFIFLGRKYHQRLFGRRHFRLFYFALGGVILALPFYLRPWILTGNPFYPFLASWFGGSEAEILTAEYHYLLGNAHFGLRSIPGFFTVFLLIAFAGKPFDGLILGWAFIAFAGLGLWWMRHLFLSGKTVWKSWIQLPAALLFYYVFWFMTSQQTRFLQPLLFLVLLAALHGIRLFRQRQQKNILIVLLIIWTGNFFYPPARGYVVGSPDWLGVRHFEVSWRKQHYFPEHAAEILRNATHDPGYFEIMSSLAQKTHPEAKVMLLFERRGLYCPRPYVIGTPYWQAKYNTPAPPTPEAFYDSLRKHHIQYLILGGSPMNPDELSGKYPAEKERLLNRVNCLVGNGKLSIIRGRNNYFLCRVW
ncbi:MAG: hypothetical protein PHH77_04500 [Victivallaceae bacterium]|nr:hypothetical protein [Victivallaceae bacterium]